jgi:hypothetical protein
MRLDVLVTTFERPHMLARTLESLWHAQVEASRRGRFRDVPVHLRRQAARDAWDVTRQMLTGRTVEAFERETRLWFVAGFLRERWI